MLVFVIILARCRVKRIDKKRKAGKSSGWASPSELVCRACQKSKDPGVYSRSSKRLEKYEGGIKFAEGALGFEPRTYRSAVDCSTTELYPHSRRGTCFLMSNHTIVFLKASE